MKGDDELIELVRENSVLYDLSHKKYQDSKFKDDIWVEIGKDLNKPAQDCKTRWNNLRDTYRKWIKKSKTPAAASLRKYKYADQLTFLDDFFQEKERLTNTNCDVKTEIMKVLISEASNELEREYDEEDVGNEDPLYEETEGEMEITSEKAVLEPKRNFKRKVFTPLNQRNPKMRQSETASSLLLKHVLEKQQSTDPIDVFLAGIAPTLKSLTPYYLNLAKSKIFSVVQEYELKMIIDDENKSSHRMESAPTASLSSWIAESDRPLQGRGNQGSHLSELSYNDP